MEYAEKYWPKGGGWEKGGEESGKVVWMGPFGVGAGG